MANEAKVQAPAKGKKKGNQVLKRLAKNKMAIVGLIVITILGMMAILAPVIAPYPFAEQDLLNTFATPSKEHICGTDDLGRDIFSRLLYGGRQSLQIGLISVSVASVIGFAIGSMCGYFGGKFDLTVMRVLDVFQAVPSLILAIAICAVLGPGFRNCIISVCVSSIPGYVRMSRASVMNIRKMEYLEAATAINCSTFRIIVRHILPNAISPLIVQMTMGVAGAIIQASSLSFVGLGVQPPNPEWGAMLSASRNYIRHYPHMVIFPGVTIMLSVLSLNMLGDGLRDALDPKLKN